MKPVVWHAQRAEASLGVLVHLSVDQAIYQAGYSMIFFPDQSQRRFFSQTVMFRTPSMSSYQRLTDLRFLWLPDISSLKVFWHILPSSYTERLRGQ